MNPTATLLRRIVAFTSLALAASVPCAADPAADISAAQDLYRTAHYEQAAQLLETMRATGSMSRDGAELLARAWVQSGRPGRARTVFAEILASDSTYRPDARVLRPEEVAAFNVAMGQRRSGTLAGESRSTVLVHAEVGYGFNGGTPSFHGFEPGIGVGVPFGDGGEGRIGLTRLSRAQDITTAGGSPGREKASAYALSVDIVRPILPSLRQVRAMGGAAILLGVSYSSRANANAGDALEYSGTGYDLHAGVEAVQAMGGGLSILGRGLVRYARAPLAAKGSPKDFELSFSGGSVSLGVQWEPGARR